MLFIIVPIRTVVMDIESKAFVHGAFTNNRLFAKAMTRKTRKCCQVVAINPPLSELIPMMIVSELIH